MKVWVSKYALTEGIEEFGDAELGPTGAYVRVGPPTYGTRRVEYFGRDAHETREAAVADAERRRVAKIASLKRQIARLEALRFEVQS